MKIRPLIIDESVREDIRRVISHAELNVYSMDDLLDLYNGEMAIAGDMEGFSCIIPVGYRVVLSYEMQNPGKMRHISISVDEDEMLPNIIAVKEIIKEFGFKNELEKCMVKLEDISPNRQAVNVWEVIE